MTTIYGSNVANGVLTAACTMAANTGGTEVAVQTTVTGTNQWTEIVSQAATLASVTAIGSPSGKGWVFSPGAGTFAAGNWSASVTLSGTAPGTTDATIRFYKYSGGTYTSIGTINKTGITGAKTAYSFAATAMGLVTFGSSDLLYVDLWWHDTGGANDNPNVYVSTSSTAGVASDVQVTTSAFSLITRVQGQATASSGAVTSQAATVGSGVTLGNLLVAAVSTGAIGNSVTPPSGWTQAVFNQPNSPANDETGLWWTVVSAGQAGSTSFTFTFGSSHNAYIIIEEWLSATGWNASPVDQTQVGNTAGTATTSTTPNTGTTSTTTQASELWIATLAYSGGVQTESSITSGWTKDLETHDSSNNHTVTMLYQVVSATGPAACQYTIGTTEHWAGAVATFKPIAATTSSRTIPATAALLATLNRAIIAASALLSTNSRNAPLAAALLGTSSRTFPATAAIANTNSRIMPAAAALDQPSSRIIPANAALLATLNRIVIAAAALLRTSSRPLPAAAALLSTNIRAVPTFATLTRTSTRTMPAWAALLATNNRIMPTAASLVHTITRTMPTAAALSSTSHRTILTSAALTIEIASGGFGLYGNGATGTVGYDMVRFNQYPDPALSLSPVLPRLGNSTVSWTDTIPPNTVLAVKTSPDGVNFTDVTAQNGGTIPGITVQPAPIIDLFNINTLVNYTNTSLSGGSVATVTYDTTNSRMTLSGGSGGLYLYSAISDNDIDMFANMDESDAGGLVWRYVDANNYYELGCYDDSSSSGFTNQLRLYKVVAGTRSLIGTASTIVWPRSTLGTSPYKIIRVTMLGTTITVYFDGTIMQTATDSTFTSGKMGLRNDGGTSRYYQLRLQQIGDYVSGNPAGDIVTSDFVYTQVSMSTTDPSVTPQLYDLSTSASSPQIAQGALIPQLHDPTKPFAEFFNVEMDTLTTTSGDFYWNVAQTGSLSFLARTATPAPWCLHSSDLLFTPNVQPTNGADLYRNRQNITNCIDTIANAEQKIADGTATSWTMAYPLYSAPTITVQGISKTVGIQGVDTGKDFYWQAASNSIGQDASAKAITSGFILQFTYVGQFPRTVTVDNLPEQAARQLVEVGTTGIIEATEDGKGMLASNATTYAQGLLAKHGNNNTIELVASTQRAGLAQGMILPVFIPEHSVNNAQLLIVKLTTTGQQQLDGSVLYQYQITATNGPNLSQWANAIFG